MAALEFFTLTADVNALVADDGADGAPDLATVSGYVDVFPRLAKGKTLWAPTLVPPRGVVVPPTRGQFVDGILRPVVGVNEVQTVTINGGPATGAFILNFAGQPTPGLPITATKAAVQAALEALSTVGEGNVSVAGNNGGPFTVTFIGDLAGLNVAALTSTNTFDTGNVAIATTTAGDPGTGIKLLACTAAVPLDSLRYDLVFSQVEYGDTPIDLASFAFAAPTTGGGTVDLASVTRIDPLPNLQPLS